MESATNDYTKRVQAGIRRQYACWSTHLESVPLEIQQDRKTIWKGVVEMFRLSDDAPATICYAWGSAQVTNGTDHQIVTVLAVPPVNSPRKAVESYLTSKGKVNHSVLPLPLYVPSALRHPGKV